MSGPGRKARRNRIKREIKDFRASLRASREDPLPPTHPMSKWQLGRGGPHPLGDYAGQQVALQEQIQRAAEETRAELLKCTGDEHCTSSIHDPHCWSVR